MWILPPLTQMQRSGQCRRFRLTDNDQGPELGSGEVGVVAEGGGGASASIKTDSTSIWGKLSTIGWPVAEWGPGEEFPFDISESGWGVDCCVLPATCDWPVRRRLDERTKLVAWTGLVSRSGLVSMGPKQRYEPGDDT